MAQFFYVAAQAGIFSFVINYMVWEVPPLLPERVGSELATAGAGGQAEKEHGRRRKSR